MALEVLLTSNPISLTLIVFYHSIVPYKTTFLLQLSKYSPSVPIVLIRNLYSYQKDLVPGQQLKHFLVLLIAAFCAVLLC